MNRKSSTLAVAVAVAIALGLPVAPAFAQSGAQTLDTVIVTGTRVADRTVAESQSPIDIITPEVLQATGSTELATALSRALPSLNFPRPALTDGTSGVRPAQLRGLSPDQVLILVNGKRRHLSGQLNVNGSMGRGSSAVDLNTIPVAAIERVEVLRDGASAQYGSDAIAGVVNIVLKGAGKGGSLALDLGQYSAGDGTQYQLSGDTGVSFADGRGTVHFAGQLSHQDRTNRAGPFNAYGLPGNPTPNTGNYPGVGVKAFVVGDPEVDTRAVSANAGFDFSDSLHGYATAIASNRDITSFAFYRSRNHNAATKLLYPDGFVPEINQYLKDRSLVAGLKGSSEGGLNWDVSYNYGYSRIDFATDNTMNYALGATSPTRFRDGALEYTHNIVNADFSQALDWGLAYPVTLSFGAEYRQEKWNQSPGEPNSYFGSGAQGFGGFTPINAVHADRHNYALYAGLEADLTDRLSAGATVRYEDYSDFGSKTSGKLSARYAFTDTVALRATVSNGFRAPSLAQQSYQVITSNYSNGVFVESGTFPATSVVAQALGSRPLQAETSTSYSLGLVLQPAERLYLTVDAFQIDIDDRILLSSTINTNPATNALLTSLGINNVTAFRYFNNAANTRTRGVDVVGSYNIPLAASALDLTASYSYNTTEVKRLAPSPAVLTGLGLTTPLVGRDEIGRLEDAFPRDKAIVGGTWSADRWSVGLNATRYGRFTVRQTNPAFDQSYDPQWVLDVSASFKPSAQWTLTVGADNVLDSHPDKVNPAFTSVNAWGQMPYSNYAPAGFNGAYVYGRIGYKW
ncbi:TonB-dependent receptor [Stenotrophomonas sp. Y6]|uniref:TonB-dependent receptor plug domain-containing protein n=1 Tax=Stenotrophomonas sp. Y6 TaxID=2920383 RepID=UPI001F052F9F|nr:TonB-dependent receptor [Stenotrophomonas sp. Y6]MCH1907632.1 TonB-dependent receptor [Stenotrophomonas sp. Y6]